MYSIGEVAKLTGITAFTLRYYEKIGVLPGPPRLAGKENGVRRYSDEDLRFIRFVHGLKQTGMRLEDIAEFAADGCLLTQDNQAIDVNDTLHKRIDILERHIQQLQRQISHLDAVKAIAQDKKNFYSALLDR